MSSIMGLQTSNTLQKDYGFSNQNRGRFGSSLQKHSCVIDFSGANISQSQPAPKMLRCFFPSKNRSEEEENTIGD